MREREAGRRLGDTQKRSRPAVACQPRSNVMGAASAGLAVRRVGAAARAELRQLDAVGVVAPVLLGDVVALLAIHARERDLGANVRTLAGHGLVLLLLLRLGCYYEMLRLIRHLA